MIECKHENKEFRKLTFASGKGFHKVLQCLDCGSRLAFNGGNNSIWWPKEKGDENLPEFDHLIVELNSEQRAEKDKKKRLEKRLYEEEKKNEEWRKKHHEYEVYINTSPEWQKIRAKVLKRAAYLCESCLEAKATQVHHTNYDSLFREIAYELRAVCRGCHQEIHNIRFAPDQPFD